MLIRPAMLVVLLLAGVGIAQADAIDTIVRAEMQRQHIPGVSIAVVRGGRIVKEKGYGLANVELGVPVTPQTVFQSASLGKQFTAALAMVLVQDGKLALDAPITTYLADAPLAWAGITLRQLLNHTSGLADSDPAIDLRKDYTEDELLQSAYRVPLAAAPGAAWRYSNLGYQVVGVLLSRAGGKFYGDQLRERLFAPLGMATTVISERRLVPHRAAGYDRTDGVLTNQAWVAPSQNTTADGSLHVTAHDLALWSISLDTAQLLSAASRGAMWAPATMTDGSTFDYGLGWILEIAGGHRIVRHDGEWQGFSNHLLRFVNEPFAVIVLTNRSHAQPQVIVDRIVAHYFPELKSRAITKASATTIASVPLFLRGDMNGWGTGARFVAVAPGVYEASAQLPAGPLAFKLFSEDWTTLDFGTPFDEPATGIGTAKAVEFRGGNFQLQVAEAGRYVFRFDATQPRRLALTVTPAVP